MSRLFSVALAFLLLSAWVFVKSGASFSVSGRGDTLAAYERQIQRGVAERLLALNKLGKAEALSRYQYRLAEANAGSDHSLGRADLFRSLVSGRFLFELGSISDQEKSRRQHLERAQERREQEAAAIRAAVKGVLALDFHRYAGQVIPEEPRP